MDDCAATALSLSGVAVATPQGLPVLTGVDLDVGWGEAVAVLGENGAGKSTLLYICLGYLRASSGRIAIVGSDPRSTDSSVKSAVAFVPEIARLYPSSSGFGLLAFFAALAGNQVSDDTLVSVLESVRLPRSVLTRRVAEYSKGMKQKLVLALGLLKGARLFLMDEPSSGLDPVAREDLARVIRNLAADKKAILFTTHDLDLVRDSSARALRLSGGRVEAIEGPSCY